MSWPIAILWPRLAEFVPTPARAVTLEVNAWQIQVRIYVHGSIAEGPYDDLEAALMSLVERLPRRRPEPWQLALGLVCRDRPAALDASGTPIWVEQGAKIATVDLEPTE